MSWKHLTSLWWTLIHSKKLIHMEFKAFRNNNNIKIIRNIIWLRKLGERWSGGYNMIEYPQIYIIIESCASCYWTIKRGKYLNQTWQWRRGSKFANLCSEQIRCVGLCLHGGDRCIFRLIYMVCFSRGSKVMKSGVSEPALRALWYERWSEQRERVCTSYVILGWTTTLHIS